MRKVLLSLLAISFFILNMSGCHSEQRKSPNIYFSSEADITDDDIKLSSRVSSTYGENILVSITSDDVLSSLEYQKSNSMLYIRYGDLECRADEDYLPSFCIIDVLIDTLEAIQKNDFSYKKTDGNYDVYKYKSAFGDTLIYVCRDSGNIEKIEPYIKDMSITFKNIKTH